MSVTLKELRISKGLNQAQCAEYLGMSTRNYQNYENDAAKANTARYHAIYQKLESYGQPVVSVSLPSQTTEFHTNVVTGAGLQALANSVAKYGKRNCFSTLRSPPDRKDNTSVSNAFRTAHRKNGLHQGADHR